MAVHHFVRLIHKTMFAKSLQMEKVYKLIMEKFNQRELHFKWFGIFTPLPKALCVW